MEERFKYEIVREKSPARLIKLELPPNDVAMIARALRENFDELVDDPTSTTGMFNKIAKEL